MKKIMFNTKYGLERAVLEGRKTQTRRVIKSLNNAYNIDSIEVGIDGHGKIYFTPYIEGKPTQDIYPTYQLEEVAVAQSYDDIYMEKNAPCPIPDEYRLNAYNKGFNQGHKGWNNKMFVLPADMPFRITINNIRIERLQDISEEDCLAEGVYYHTEPPKHHECDRYSPWNPSVKPYKFESKKYFCSAKYAFKHLIEKVSGKGTWDSNPWVFVYDFELIK